MKTFTTLGAVLLLAASLARAAAVPIVDRGSTMVQFSSQKASDSTVPKISHVVPPTRIVSRDGLWEDELRLSMLQRRDELILRQSGLFSAFFGKVAAYVPKFNPQVLTRYTPKFNPQVLSRPRMPALPKMSMPKMPTMPKMPNMPTMPKMPTMPRMRMPELRSLRTRLSTRPKATPPPTPKGVSPPTPPPTLEDPLLPLNSMPVKRKRFETLSLPTIYEMPKRHLLQPQSLGRVGENRYSNTFFPRK